MGILFKWGMIIFLLQALVGAVTYRIFHSLSATADAALYVAIGLSLLMLLVSQKTHSLEYLAACILSGAAAFAVPVLTMRPSEYLILDSGIVVFLCAAIGKEIGEKTKETTPYVLLLLGGIPVLGLLVSGPIVFRKMYQEACDYKGFY